MKLHVFGDSHAEYLFHRVREADVHWLGPWTMHRVARDGVCFVRDQIRDFEPDDVVILVFGEIDIRCHLGRIADRDSIPLDRIAEHLATEFVKNVAMIFNVLPSARIMILEPVPPITPTSINTDFPVYGSEHERVVAHQKLAKSLKIASVEYGILFHPMPKYYVTKRGSLKFSLSDGVAHIAQDNTSQFCDSLARSLNVKLHFEKGSFLLFFMRQIARFLAIITRKPEKLWALGHADATDFPRFW